MKTLDRAAALFELGYQPIPIAPGEKYPSIKGWPDADCAKLVENWDRCYKGHGIGLRTGKLSAIDVDIYDSGLVDLLVEEIKAFPNILTRVGQPPKTLIPCIIPELKTKTTSTKWIDDNGVINQIELLSFGQQFVCCGRHPDTKKPYEWSEDLLTTSLPVIPFKFLVELFIIFDIEAERKGFINASLVEKTSQDARKTRSRTYRGDIGNAPGSIYNRVTPIEDVLEHYGWRSVVGSHWRRPGKKKGISGHVEDGFLMCFTTSTCLPGASDGRFPSVHDSFDLLAFYEHRGDKSEAAKAILEAAR